MRDDPKLVSAFASSRKNRTVPEKGNDASFAGYHSFLHDETNTEGKTVGQTPCGSFEVFYRTRNRDIGLTMETGWYWWACFPGCMPDGDPNGPFPTAEGAYLDAIGD